MGDKPKCVTLMEKAGKELAVAVKQCVLATSQKSIVLAQCMNEAESMSDSAKKPAESKLEREAKDSARYAEACTALADAEGALAEAKAAYDTAKLTAEFELAAAKV